MRGVTPDERLFVLWFVTLGSIQFIRHNNDIPTSLERATMNLPSNAATTTSTTTTKVPPLPSPIHHGTWWDEAKRLLNLAIPASIIKMGNQVPQMIAIAVVGKRFGPEYLGACGFTKMVGMIFIVAFLQGLLTATDTLAPQAYGANNKRQVGILAIRGAVVCFVCIVPINTVLCMYLEEILLWMGQPPLASKYAEEYCRAYLWGIPFTIVYFVGWKFLAAQGNMRPLMYVTIISMLVTLPLSLQFFVNKYGFVGAALALDCFQVSQAILLLGYLVWFQPHDKHTWEGLSVWREALDWKEVKVYLSLGFGGVLSLNEWLFWEGLALVAGRLGALPLTISTIALQVPIGLFMVPIGLAYALSIRIGTVISRDYRYAQRLMLICSTIFVVVDGLLCFALYWWHLEIIGLFTSDPAVVEVSGGRVGRTGFVEVVVLRST